MKVKLLKRGEFKMEIPDRCPKCQNPNSNIEGSIYAEEFKITIKCMQCGLKYQADKLILAQ
jgi:uncharacterized protein (DUF983 family)